MVLRSAGEVGCAHCTRMGADGKLQRQGPAIEYHPDGTIAARGAYANGEKSGVWSQFHENGKKKGEADACRFHQGLTSRMRFRMRSLNGVEPTFST